ncbi:F-box/WD repeat-containing protein 12-like [Eptesicus fuscus]|uniref:F-box/WD repeat-containing protein 12-like n=1 Tax=Eptesicus fuscus TaxID=29078 RepID=UPI002403A9E9|nr:F-box/WD repeat-containing protein 12-like [Eptesicus fuscus]
MEIQLPEVPMLHIFSFLDAASLLQVGQVSKYWKNIADEEHLWRNLCQRRWSISWEGLQVPSWKQLFLTHARRERCMMRAKPQDFAYKESTDTLGLLRPLAYLSGSGPSMGEQKSVICTVSSKCMLCAWDVQEGLMIWSSPTQPTGIKRLATLPQRSLAFTLDGQETIKVWNCRDVNPLATLTMRTICSSMEVFLTDDRPVLMIGDSEGDIHTLTVPELKSVSRVNAFEHRVVYLHCSPNRKWIFASGTHQFILPKVFFAECLLRPSVGMDPLFVTLLLTFCTRACWALKCANRLTIMFRKEFFRRTAFVTFDMTAESPGGSTAIQAHQIASFMLADNMDAPECMGVCDGTTIVFESGRYLFLVTIHGHLLQKFDHHQNVICYIWMDPLHVLTTSMDNYLHLYMWEEGDCHPRLQSCCHLEQKKDDKRPNCAFPIAICDNTSIVCVVSKRGQASFLVMYSLNT